jgi:hypothetical protein
MSLQAFSPLGPAAKPRLMILPGILVAVMATVGLTQSPESVGPAQLSGPGGAVPASAEAIARVGSAGDMIGFSYADAAGTQIITLVHTRKSWMAVYHVDRSGIRLVSSRPIDADFSLQLNATSPLPEEIREIGRR